MPTVRRSILPINSALHASASFIAAMVCFHVLELNPNMTTPPAIHAPWQIYFFRPCSIKTRIAFERVIF